MKHKILLPLISVLLFSIVTNAQIITNGLVGYYPFTGNANDQSGNSNNGTEMNGVALTADRFGNANAAYFFDGIDDYISLPPAAFKNNEYTYSTWIKTNTLPNSGEYVFMISIGELSSGGDQAIILDNGYFNLYGWLFSSYYNNFNTRIYIGNATPMPNLNTWYHLVLTRNNTEMKMYVNGLLVGFTSALGTTPYYGSTTNAFIGARCDFQSNSNFNGSIDDVYFFNRVLSASEVLALYYDCSATGKCKNLISGNIYNDLNGNCTNDGGDAPLANWLVKILPGSLYGISDNNGNWQAWVDTGTYTVSEILPNKLWNSSCPPSQTVNVTGIGDTTGNINFANTGIICPLMWVDISTSFLRNCPTHDFDYMVNYCNNGTAVATNAYIDIAFTPDFNITGSTLAWTSVSGTTYRFDVGTLTPGQCGGFKIQYQLDCDNQLGQSICVKAKIYPDTICEPVDTAWDKSSLKVDGECVGDSVRFVIYNHGSGDMTANSEYRIYINDTLSQTNSFKLNSGDSLVIIIAACGNTIRLEADQRPGHPGHSHPRATVEGCGGGCGTVNYGYVTTIAEDDEDANVEWDCNEVRGSFDPNEKLVKPTGMTANRYISSKDEMEYQINFQNTGTDTAFFIRVRDTLPQYLDISTIQIGAGSHPYTLRVFGNNILEWTFENVNLVDSFTNEASSHGYLKFKVKQTANNADGTVINNGAGIYFDTNQPVQTDITSVTVNDSYVLGVKEKSMVKKSSAVKVYPNPFSNKAEFRIQNSELKIEKLELRIYDILGQEKKKLSIINNQSTIINSEGLSSGMYFYKVYSERNLIGTGKLVIQK